MVNKLAEEITRSLASDDFDEALARLPEVQELIDLRLSAASNDAERETILAEAVEWNRRWLGIAHALRASIASQLRSLEAESRYAEPADGGHVFDIRL